MGSSFNSPQFNESEFNGGGASSDSPQTNGMRFRESGQQGGVSQKPESENKVPNKAARIAFYEGPLKELLREAVHGDIDTERTRQLQLADKYDKYMRGKQFLYPGGTGSGDSTFTAQGIPNGTEVDVDGWLDYVYNLTADLGRKFRGVLGQKGPRVKAVANDPDSPNDKAASAQGDLAAQKLLFDWDYDNKQAELAMLLWQSGTTFGYSRYVADEERWGSTTIPKVEIREAVISPAGYICPQCEVRTSEESIQKAMTCPNCGAALSAGNYVEADTVPVPQFTSTMTYPNGKVALDLCDVTTVATPYTAKTCHDTPWLYYRYEEFKSRLLSIYPELREKIGDGGAAGLGTGDGSSETGIQVRDAAASPSALGTSRRTNRWTFTRYWIRRYMFEQLKDAGVRAQAKKDFPDGLKIVMVGDNIVDLVEERLETVWTACKPEASKYIWCDAYCRDAVALNDPVNDALNILIETLERGIPLTFMDPMQVDPTTVNGPAKPAEIKWTKMGQGKDLAIHTLKTADLPDGLIPAIQFIIAKAQQAVGILPSIWGGDEGKDQTFRGQLLKRNQALMQLAECYNNTRRFAEDTFKNGALQLDKYSPDDQIKVPGMSAEPGAAVPMIKRGVMTKGEWHYEAEPSIPMTHGERRDQFTDMLQNPMVAQSMGLFDVQNRALANDLIGLPELMVPGADLRQVVEATIQDMLRKKEVPLSAPDPMTGQITQQPSREPERNLDPQAVAGIVNEWLLTPPARALFGTPEYENIVLLWEAYRKAGQPPPPPPGAPPAPPQAGAPPPHGKPGRPPMAGPKPGPGFGVPPPPANMPGQENALAGPVQ